MADYSTKHTTQSGVGVSEPIKFNGQFDDFAVLINAYVTGTVVYDIEYTIDDASIPQWLPLGDVNRETSSDDSMYFPLKALRVNIKSGTGSIKLVTLNRD